MNLSETINLIRFYKKKKFTDEETKAYLKGEKNLLKGHTHLYETNSGFNLWYNHNGRMQMITISRKDFFGLFYDDEFEVDESKMAEICAGEPKCIPYTNC